MNSIMEVGVNTGVQVCTRKKMKIAGFSKKKKKSLERFSRRS